MKKSGRNEPCFCGSGIKAKRCKCKASYDLRKVKDFIETDDVFKTNEFQTFLNDLAKSNDQVMEGLMVDCGLNAGNRDEFTVEDKPTPLNALTGRKCERQILGRKYLVRNGSPVGYVETTTDYRSYMFTAHKIGNSE